MKHQKQHSQLQTQIKQHNEYIIQLVKRYAQFIKYKYHEQGIVFASKGFKIKGYEGSDIYAYDYSIYTLINNRYILKDESVSLKIERLMSMRFYTND